MLHTLKSPDGSNKHVCNIVTDYLFVLTWSMQHQEGFLVMRVQGITYLTALLKPAYNTVLQKVIDQSLVQNSSNSCKIITTHMTNKVQSPSVTNMTVCLHTPSVLQR